MTKVADIYGGVPANCPLLPARLVLPLPKGHGHTFTNPNVSPWSIVSDDGVTPTALPTSCVPIRWDSDGEPRAVLLTAIASDTELGETLSVTDDASASDEGEFTLDGDLQTASIVGFKFKVTTHEGVYEAVIKAEHFNLEVNKTTACAKFRLPVHRVGTLGALPQFGVITGLMRAYSGIDVIDLDILWHQGDWDVPVGMNYFEKVELIIPVGLHAQSKQRGTYWGGGAGAGGAGTVVVFAKPTDPPAGTSPSHCALSQSGKVIQYSIFKDVTADIPDWADDWCSNNGVFYTHGVDADPTLYNGLNPATPITFNGLPMCNISSTLSNDLSVTETHRDWPARITPFLAERDADENSDLLGGDPTESATSWRNRIFNRDGGGTGGALVFHNMLWAHSMTSDVRLPDFLWNLTGGIVDRWCGFLDYLGEPFSLSAFQEASPGVEDLGYRCGPSAYSTNHLTHNLNWDKSKAPNVSDDSDLNWAKKFLDNRGLALPSQDFDETRHWGSIDTQHYTRLYISTQTIAELTGDPFAVLLLQYFAASAMLVKPNPFSQSLYYGSAGKGAEIGRDEGWTAHVCSAVYAFTPPTGRVRGVPRDCYIWCSNFAKMVYRAQMPHGACIAWGSGGNNKEYRNARETKLRPVLEDFWTASGSALPIDPATGVSYTDIEDVPFEKLEQGISKEAVAQLSVTAEVARVTQLYQEAILMDGTWSTHYCCGIDLSYVLLRGLAFGLLIARGAGDAATAGKEPWYRFAVYAEATPYLIPTNHDALYDLYSSDYDIVDTGNKTTAHHFKWMLGLACKIAQENSYLTALSHAVIVNYDADYETTADDSGLLLENGEAALSSLQLTA